MSTEPQQNIAYHNAQYDQGCNRDFCNEGQLAQIPRLLTNRNVQSKKDINEQVAATSSEERCRRRGEDDGNLATPTTH